MCEIIVFNKMNNVTRTINERNVTDAINKARRIAKAIAKKGGWTIVEEKRYEMIAFFDYTNT